jgi:shikimate kinase
MTGSRNAAAAGELAGGPVRRVVLVGFMTSGKTTVGAALAQRLGWRHLDLDAEIERAEGRTVAEIFAARGESAFRRLEAELTPRLLARERSVLSVGGGWVSGPAWRALPEGTLSVWLRVSAEEVLRRAGPATRRRTRPLLAVADPEAEVRRLLREREPLYRLAEVSTATDGRDAAQVAAEIERIVRGRDAAPPRD